MVCQVFLAVLKCITEYTFTKSCLLPLLSSDTCNMAILFRGLFYLLLVTVGTMNIDKDIICSEVRDFMKLHLSR